MREKFVPKEVGECAVNPGKDGEEVCLESLDHSSGRVAAVHVGGDDL